MSNLGSLNRKRQGLVDKLEKLREDRRPKAIEFGTLARTPKYDQLYSVVRFYWLENQLEKMREREADLQHELDEINLEISLAEIKSA